MTQEVHKLDIEKVLTKKVIDTKLYRHDYFSSYFPTWLGRHEMQRGCRQRPSLHMLVSLMQVQYHNCTGCCAKTVWLMYG